MAQQVSQGVAAGYVARYSRDQELQADQLGAEYLARSNYEPEQHGRRDRRARSSQERFAADAARAEGPRRAAGADWLSSHPSNEQRLQRDPRDRREVPAARRYGDDGRARYLQAIDGLPFGESREQGVTRGRNFYHEPLGVAITAPQGWRIQNSAEALAIVNPEGNAGLVRAGGAAEGRHHARGASCATCVKPDQGRTEQRSLNGQPATHFVGTRRTEQGSPAGGRHRGHRARRAQLPAALRRRGPGRAAARLSAAPGGRVDVPPDDRGRPQSGAPWTLQTVHMPRGGFAELARRAPLTTHAEQQLRLLNGAYGGGAEPQPGQPVKTVE